MGKPLIPAQRRQQIIEFLKAHQIAQIAELSERLGASEATIRRDLEWLEGQGLAERTHGGALLTQRMPLEPAYAFSAQAHPEEKRRIGRAAAGLVNDGETVFVNSGTTATQFIRHLRLRPDLRSVTVITNNVTAVLEARDDSGLDAILLGGQFRTVANSTFGLFANAMLRQLSADKAVIGIDGITLRFGVTTPAGAEAEIAQVMIERTRGPVIAIFDHSKWGVVSNFEIAPLERFHGVVVDDGLAPEHRAALEARSLSVLVAGDEPAPAALDLERPHVPVR